MSEPTDVQSNSDELGIASKPPYWTQTTFRLDRWSLQKLQTMVAVLKMRNAKRGKEYKVTRSSALRFILRRLRFSKADMAMIDPRAIARGLHQTLAESHGNGALFDGGAWEAWLMRELDIATPRAAGAFTDSLQRLGMVRRTSEGRIRFLNPPNPNAPMENSHQPGGPTQ